MVIMLERYCMAVSTNIEIPDRYICFDGNNNKIKINFRCGVYFECFKCGKPHLRDIDIFAYT